jgi:hypothetical protein
MEWKGGSLSPDSVAFFQLFAYLAYFAVNSPFCSLSSVQIRALSSPFQVKIPSATQKNPQNRPGVPPISPFLHRFSLPFALVSLGKWHVFGLQGC